MSARCANHKQIAEDAMKKIIALCMLSLALAGCNTMSGFGRDVQTLGAKVEGAAKK
jgi:entericidin A